MKIIVIDDDPLIRSMLHAWFSQRGHTIITYSSPLECPSYSGTGCPCAGSDTCPDIVISDYNMPKVSGYDFIKHLRDHGCPCAKRIVLITGSNTTALALDLVRLRTLEIRIWFKPFALKDLEAWIQDAVAPRGSQIQNEASHDVTDRKTSSD